jgi:hypothetical protein
MPRCRTLRLNPVRALGMQPRNDSAERTFVPHQASPAGTHGPAWIPMLTPVHPISRGGSTLASVETSDADPDFHWNRARLQRSQTPTRASCC